MLLGGNIKQATVDFNYWKDYPLVWCEEPQATDIGLLVFLNNKTASFKLS